MKICMKNQHKTIEVHYDVCAESEKNDKKENLSTQNISRRAYDLCKIYQHY